MINGGASLQRLQPVVLLGERCLAPTHGPEVAGSLLMPSGTAHPLRCVCTIRTLLEHQRAVNLAALAAEFQAEVKRQRAADGSDPLDYVVGTLAPAWLGSFLGEAMPPPPTPPKSPSFTASALSPCAEEDEILADAPFPRFVTPAVGLFGRFWLLRRTTPGAGRMQVRVGGETFGVSGDYVLFRSLDEEWRQQLTEYLQRRVKQGRPRNEPRPAPALSRAREAFAQQGYWQQGDLLFIAGNPPWLAYVIPPHFNYALGRHSQRDLAFGLPWLGKAEVGSLRAFAYEPGRGWRHFAPPKGICLGPGPDWGGKPPPEDPLMRARGILSWATERVAQNGMFHEHDVQSQSE